MLRWFLILVLAMGSAASCDAQEPAPSDLASVPEAVNEPTPSTPAQDQPGCQAQTYAGAAAQNSATLRGLAWTPFGRPETGWEIYAPAIAFEIATGCAPDSSGFAARLADWQKQRGLSADGVLTPEVFEQLKAAWRDRRPHIGLREVEGGCPEPPDEATLATATPAESFGGKTIQLQLGALYAYRRMVAAAKAEVPEIARDPEALTIFSGYRSPTYDAQRCERDQNCDGIVRASCSPHRTGRVVDVVVGRAPGFNVDQSDDVNRLHMSRTPTYRWLVANAHRFGFYNYVFEPWHWEWLGYAPPRQGPGKAPESAARNGT